MASRAVTVRRVYVKRRTQRSRSHASSARVFPLAVVAGFMPRVIETVRQAKEGWATKDIFGSIVYDFTGFNTTSGTFNLSGLIKGWTPVLMGFAIHYFVGEKLGVNRMIRRMGSPVGL